MPASPTVTCLPRGGSIEPREDETLLDAALRTHVPLASSCGGRAVCGDCVVTVHGGRKHVTPPDADELAWRARSDVVADVRLACCLRVLGPVEVSTTYW